MSAFRRCGNCGDYGWSDRHVCATEWRAWTEEYEGISKDASSEEVLANATRVFGYDARAAAEKWLEQFSDFECPHDEGDPATVHVRKCVLLEEGEADVLGPVQTFSAYWYVEKVFTASEVSL